MGFLPETCCGTDIGTLILFLAGSRARTRREFGCMGATYLPHLNKPMAARGRPWEA
jgi:hypothetical protein